MPPQTMAAMAVALRIAAVLNWIFMGGDYTHPRSKKPRWVRTGLYSNLSSIPGPSNVLGQTAGHHG